MRSLQATPKGHRLPPSRSPGDRPQTDPGHTSEVEVRFTAEDKHRTRVELEHRNLARHGPGWEDVRDGVAHDQGWPLYLDRYATLFADGG